MKNGIKSCEKSITTAKMVAADLEKGYKIRVKKGFFKVLILFCNTLYDFYNNIFSNKLYLCRQKLK